MDRNDWMMVALVIVAVIVAGAQIYSNQQQRPLELFRDEPVCADKQRVHLLVPSWLPGSEDRAHVWTCGRLR